MILECKVNISVELYHKLTGNKIELKDEIVKALDEDSEEYKEYCKLIDVQMKDNEGKDVEYGKAVLEHLSEQAKEESREQLDQALSVFKECYIKNNVRGCVSFAGTVLNPHDFCLIKVNDYRISLSRRESRN